MDWFYAFIVRLLRDSFLLGISVFLLPKLIFVLYLFIFAGRNGEKITVGKILSTGNGACIAAIPFAVVIALSTPLFYQSFTSRIIYFHGIETVGEVVAIKGTATTINGISIDRHVVRYPLANNQIIQSSFLTVRGAIYPKPKHPAYPGEKEIVRLRYLPKYPRGIVVVEDPVADQCRGIAKKIAEIELAFDFLEKQHTDNRQLRDSFAAENQRYADLDCRQKLTPVKNSTTKD